MITWEKNKNNKKSFYKHVIKETFKELKKFCKVIVSILLIPERSSLQKGRMVFI